MFALLPDDKESTSLYNKPASCNSGSIVLLINTILPQLHLVGLLYIIDLLMHGNSNIKKINMSLHVNSAEEMVFFLVTKNYEHRF